MDIKYKGVHTTIGSLFHAMRVVVYVKLVSWWYGIDEKDLMDRLK